MERRKVIKCIPLALFFILSVSCTKSNESRSVHQVWLPWADTAGVYHIEKIEVKTVSQWSPLRGGAAQIRSHVSKVGKNSYSSQEVSLEYTRDREGVIIPMTQFSTEVASIYAHMERLQKIDLDLGLPEAGKARKVYVRFFDTQGPFSRTLNNAFYDLSVDSFFIGLYQLDGLPLSANGGVLAHEHFHSIFGRLILRPMLEVAASRKKELKSFEPDIFEDLSSAKKEIMTAFFSEEPLEHKKNLSKDHLKIDPDAFVANTTFLEKSVFINRVLMMGLNEGLADLWAWFYSGNPCFMEPSFHKNLSDERCLNVNNPETLVMVDTNAISKHYLPWGDQTRQILTQGYLLGSNLARMIYLRIQEQGNVTPEHILAWQKHVIEALPTFLPALTTVFVEEEMRKTVLPWEKFVDTLLFGPSSVSISSTNCERWENILRSVETLENFRSVCKK